jgi:hypothetical protein
MSDIIFTVETEVGVKGYHHSDVTYKGTLDEVKAALEKASVDLANELVAAEERDGDLRQFCGSYANGYPMLDHLDSAEKGDDFDITIISVKQTQTVVTEVEVDYHDSAYTAFREAVGEEITEGFDSKAHRENALGIKQRACLIEAYRNITTRYHNRNPLEVWSGFGYKTAYKDAVADGFMHWAGDSGEEPEDREQAYLILTEKGVEMLRLMGFKFS